MPVVGNEESGDPKSPHAQCPCTYKSIHMHRCKALALKLVIPSVCPIRLLVLCIECCVLAQLVVHKLTRPSLGGGGGGEGCQAMITA